MVVPRIAVAGRSCEAALGEARLLKSSVSGRFITLIVEGTHGGCAHACTPEDIFFMLSHIPVDDWEGMETIVLRQSTRKMRLLKPAWGRLYYWAELRFRSTHAPRRGPVIFLEATEPDARFSWSTSLDRDDAEELERLRTDGHLVERDGRRHLVSTTVQATRATQLYRTLLHEIGHWADWLEKVERPANRGEDFTMLSERYFARPSSEREAFAHRYANRLRARLERDGIIPFAQIGGAA